MSYLDWKVGDRIVCIDDTFTTAYSPYPIRNHTGLDGLRAGSIYTVRSIQNYRGAITVSLKEIVRPILPGDEPYGEAGYAVQRFRPVQPRKTDISVFTAMLHDVKRSEPVMLSTPWGRVPA